jgi:hypothetical protein
VARQFREGQGNDELTQCDDRPAPEEDAADCREAQEKEREDAGRRRDVAERDSEGAEDAETAAQLLLVAEARKISLVARRLAGRLVVDVHHAGALQVRRSGDLVTAPRTC